MGQPHGVECYRGGCFCLSPVRNTDRRSSARVCTTNRRQHRCKNYTNRQTGYHTQQTVLARGGSCCRLNVVSRRMRIQCRVGPSRANRGRSTELVDLQDREREEASPAVCACSLAGSRKRKGRALWKVIYWWPSLQRLLVPQRTSDTTGSCISCAPTNAGAESASATESV